MSLLEFSNVTLRFGGVVAVDEVSFSVKEGEVFAIVGPNGAGKSTIFNLISRFYDPAEGQITFDGENLLDHPSHDVAKLGVARTFQNIELFENASVLQNLLVGRHRFRKSNLAAELLFLPSVWKSEREHRHKVEEAIDFLDLQPYRDQMIAGLPYGVRKVVEMGRALALAPKLLLLDEPASGLSVEETRDVAFWIEDIKKQMGITVLMVEHDMHLVNAVSDRVMALTKAIIYDPDGLHDFEDDRVILLDDLYRIGREHLAQNPDLFEAEIAKSTPNDTASLVYTSGTTGPPKGAMISHENIIYSLSAGLHSAPTLATDEQIAFLPLCHILERLFSGFGPIASRAKLNFAESPETVFDNMREVSPHTFVAVPRVWEKVFSRVTILVNDATRLQRWAYNRAVASGMKIAQAELDGTDPGVLAKLTHRFWDALVLANVRRMLGMDRMRRGGSGAAPISPDLLMWFRAIGVNLLEGYGMTESGGLISINTSEDHKLGTVGQPIPGSEIRIGEGGEILYRAANVFQGYWKKPEKTAETITEDGWLRTGDVGRVDNEGFVTITGRMKDIIITAGGKNITPAEIENRLKFSPYVSDAVVIGDRRKYLSCLIMIDQENVEKFAQGRRVPFSDFRSLCASDEVVKLISEVVADTNKAFARVEQIKDFRLIDVLLTAEDDELTATMKLKRSFVEKKYADLIHSMYKGG